MSKIKKRSRTVDPTRTQTLQRAALAHVAGRFDALRRGIAGLVTRDDVFGASASKMRVANAATAPASPLRVCIVGGGPGGLFAALRVRQAFPTASVVVLEASDRLGGKVRTHRFAAEPGLSFEAGVAELYRSPPGKPDLLHDLIESLGLRTFPVAGDKCHIDGRWVDDMDGKNLVRSLTINSNPEGFNQYKHSLGGINLVERAKNLAEAKQLREKRANTPVPESVKLPDKLYVSMSRPHAEKALEEGHTGEHKGILGHDSNRVDSVYLATRKGITKHYAGMQHDPKVLEIDTTKLDRSRVYYDATEPPPEEGESFGDHNPGYIAYRGKVPAHAIKIVTTNLGSSSDVSKSDMFGMDLDDAIATKRPVTNASTAGRSLDRFDELCRTVLPPDQYHDAKGVNPGASHPWRGKTFREVLDLLHPNAAAYVEAYTHSDVAVEPHQTSALYGAINWLMNHEEYLTIYTIAGGIERLTYALASVLFLDPMVDIRLNCRVDSVARVGRTGAHRVAWDQVTENTGWPGPCPDCGAQPSEKHKPHCPGPKTTKNYDPNHDELGRFASSSDGERYIRDKDLADEVDLTGLTPRETAGVARGLEESLTLPTGQRLKLRSVKVKPGSTESVGMGYSNGHVIISPKTVISARAHDPSEIVNRYKNEPIGKRSFSLEDAKDSADYLRIGVAHEVGHHVEDALGLDQQKAARDVGAPHPDDVLRVSGYATTHPAEAFAETHAMLSTGRQDLVPQKVRQHYAATLRTADPNPIRQFVRNTRTNPVADLLDGVTENCQPGQIRGADGRCGHGVGIGIDRTEMPQILGEDIAEFLDWAKEQGVVLEVGWVSAKDLTPVQKEFRQERIDAIPVEKLSDPILISESGGVLDGTHRWLKQRQKGPDEPLNVVSIGLPTEDALDLMRRFPKAKFVANMRVRPGADLFDRVLVCLPAQWLTRVDYGASDDAVRTYATSNGYDVLASYLRVTLLFSRKFWEEGAAGKGSGIGDWWMSDAFGGCCVYDESARARGGSVAGVLGWLIAGDSAMTMGNLTDDQLAEMCVASLPKEWRAEAELLYQRVEVNRFIGEVAGMPGDSTKVVKGSRVLADPSDPGLLFVGDYQYDGTLNGVLKSAGDAVRFMQTGSLLQNSRTLDLVDPVESATANVGPTSDRIVKFRSWLDGRVHDLFHGPDSVQHWRGLAKSAYLRGLGRSHDDVRGTAPVRNAATADELALNAAADPTRASAASAARQARLQQAIAGYGADESTADFYAGSKAEFLSSAFNTPVAQDRLDVLSGRSLDAMKGVTGDMVTKMQRILTDGMSSGASRKQMVDDLADQVGLSQTRANTVVRTEVVRAHAEGQLDSLEKMGVKQIGVDVEFTDTADDATCPICDALEGEVYTIDEARGVIPVHPNCFIDPNTLVECAGSRWRSIVDIEVGDGVVTHLKRVKTVTQVHRNRGQAIVVVITANGRQLVLTSEHSILCNGDWVRAGLVMIGDSVSGMLVSGVVHFGFTGDLYNLSVEDDESYCVQGGFIVHNCRCAWSPYLGDDPSTPTSNVENAKGFFGHAGRPGHVGGSAPGPIHAQSGLTIGHVHSKTYRGIHYLVEVVPTGFKVTGGGTVRDYPSLTAAAKGIRGNNAPISGWEFFNVLKPTTTGSVPHVPPPTPHAVAAVATGAVHAASGLPVGDSYTKVTASGTHVLTVTPTGFDVRYPDGSTKTYSSLTAAAMGVRGHNAPVSGWAYFKVARPIAGPTAPPIASPIASPLVRPLPTIPYATKQVWKTGVPELGILNGIPFAEAPHKFWESTKDADVGEPPPLRTIDRVGVMVKEPDGRVWIVQPTNEFGGRKHTLPGGGVEPGLTDQQNALKEVWEETGLQVKITGHLGDFEDSNNQNNGRLYVGERIGGAPWGAKIESKIIDRKTGRSAAESESVTLVTPELAAKMLHRTDDLAQLATVHPIPLGTNTSGNVIKKLLDGIDPAAKAYVLRQKVKGRHAGNADLHAVRDLRGFNGVPTLLSKSQMDDLISKGDHIDLLRGVRGHGSSTATDLANELKTGDHFPGHGVFGSGTYADSNPSSNAATRNYGLGGTVIRMALPKSAKVIEQSNLENLVPNPPPNFKKYGGAGSARECWQGVQAALAGYDAIHVDGKSKNHGSYGKGFYIILNRSILSMQKESAVKHVIK